MRCCSVVLPLICFFLLFGCTETRPSPPTILSEAPTATEDGIHYPSFDLGMTTGEVREEILSFVASLTPGELPVKYPLPLLHIMTEEDEGDTIMTAQLDLPGDSLHFIFFNDSLEALGTWAPVVALDGTIKDQLTQVEIAQSASTLRDAMDAIPFGSIEALLRTRFKERELADQRAQALSDPLPPAAQKFFIRPDVQQRYERIRELLDDFDGFAFPLNTDRSDLRSARTPVYFGDNVDVFASPDLVSGLPNPHIVVVYDNHDCVDKVMTLYLNGYRPVNYEDLVERLFEGPSATGGAKER